MRIPAALDSWRGWPGGAAWLDRLPALVAECAEQWTLVLDEPLSGGNVALVVAARRADGSPAVLKLSFPEHESEHEADALLHWGGEAAVRLLERDDDRRALLLERVLPGTPLWETEDDARATAAAAEALARLHRAPPPPDHPFRTLDDAAGRWATTIPAGWEASGRAYPERLVALAVDACRALGGATGAAALLHQDFHGGNLLRSAERGWVAIDPKPLVGDPAFDAASLVRDRRWLLGGGDDAARLRRRLDVLVDVTALDRERMRLWGVVHALAWAVTGAEADPEMVRCAELLAEV